jgi:hypothetical protein
MLGFGGLIVLPPHNVSRNGLRRQINFVSRFKPIQPVRPSSAKFVLPFFRKI